MDGNVVVGEGYRHGGQFPRHSAKLEKLVKFGPSERDLVMLQHKFVVGWENRNTISIFEACLFTLNVIYLFRKHQRLFWSYLEIQPVTLSWPHVSV